MKKTGFCAFQKKIETTFNNPSFTLTAINGFLNVSVTDKTLVNAFKTQTCSPSQTKQKDKILLEYISANPTGPLHIGHARWAVIGSVLSQILIHCGYQVTQEFYINDAGEQVKNFYTSIEAIQSNKEIPENGYHGAYMKELSKGTTCEG